MRRNIRGFTLIELLMVVAIIAMILSMGAPAINGYRKQRSLKQAASIIQGVFVQARSVAVSQQQEVRVAFFVDSETTTLTNIQPSNVSVKGDLHTIYTYIIDKTDPANHRVFLYGQPTALPENTRFFRLSGSAINKTYIVNANGTIFFTPDSDNDPEDEALANPEDNLDVAISQEGNTLRCYIDIVRNTGRTRSSVR